VVLANSPELGLRTNLELRAFHKHLLRDERFYVPPIKGTCATRKREVRWWLKGVARIRASRMDVS
jgi:hypothetical protein